MSKSTPRKPQPAASAQRTSSRPVKSANSFFGTGEKLLFGKTNYIWMAIGLAIIFLGLLLMSGGNMPSPDVWDPKIIYSNTRTVLAPILILTGLGIQIYAIFKRS